MITPDFDVARRWAKLRAHPSQFNDDDANLARAYLALEDRIAEVERERDAMRAANEGVAVCRKHVSDVLGDGCLVCKRDALARKVERVRSALLVPNYLQSPCKMTRKPCLRCAIHAALTVEEQT